MIAPGAFLALTQTITKTSPIKAKQKATKRFVSTFGSKPSFVSLLWDLLEVKTLLPRGFRPIHLLWTLCFVKLYSSQATLSSLGCDEKTFRKWVWLGLETISDLELASFVMIVTRTFFLKKKYIFTHVSL
jgi:hypothetical protein